MNNVFAITQKKLDKPDWPSFRVGDVVRLYRKVKEGEKERTQIIEGVVISHKHGFQPGATITIRRVASGVAVEMVFPLYSPQTEKIQIVKRQKVRRAKLYYLRSNKGKRSKLKENIEATRNLRNEENERITKKKEEEEERKTAKKTEEKDKKEEKETLEEEKKE